MLSYGKLIGKQFLTCLAIVLGVFLLWSIILAVVLFGFRENSAPTIASFLLNCSGAGALVYFIMHLFLYRFPMAVTMGIPRKTLFPMNLVFAILLALVFLGVTFVCSQLESYFLASYAQTHPGFEVVPFDVFGLWWVSSLIYLAAIFLGLVLSAMLLRFGASAGARVSLIGWFFIIFAQSQLDQVPYLSALFQWVVPIFALVNIIWSIRQFYTMTL